MSKKFFGFNPGWLVLAAGIIVIGITFYKANENPLFGNIISGSFATIIVVLGGYLIRSNK